MIILIGWFDQMRQTHTCKIPQLNKNGAVKKGWFGAEKSEMVIVGTENDMTATARTAYLKAGSPGICKFLGGYGVNQVNNPQAIWPKERLASISSKLNLLVIGILLCGVMALYLSASVFEIYQRPVPAVHTQE
jgi:hypothetical protein